MKKHISLWIEDDVLEMSDINQELANVKNRNDYVEAALKFYNGYLHNKKNFGFIDKTFIAAMQGMMNSFENRMSRQMFKQAVEISKIFWMIAKNMGIDPSDVDEFHEECVEEVKRINGAIEFPHLKKDDE